MHRFLSKILIRLKMNIRTTICLLRKLQKLNIIVLNYLHIIVNT